MKDILNNATDRMKKAEASLERELGSIRAGVANASLLDRIEVEYYGALTPVNQLASINIPEARMLTIPALTEERRKDLAKLVGKNSENAKVAVRNIRRDAMDALKKAEKSGDISEDELHVNEKKVQELTDASTKRIDEIAAKKETELLDK